MINDNKRYKYNSKYNNHITVLLLHLKMVHTFLSSRFTPYRPLFPLMGGGSGAPSPSGAPADVGRKKNSYFPLYWLLNRDPYNGLL